jgi:hypothetical protein
MKSKKNIKWMNYIVSLYYSFLQEWNLRVNNTFKILNKAINILF